MSLNYKEVNLILDELDLSGSRIDKINQPERFSLYLETYNNHKKQKILICLTHGAVRLHHIQTKPQFPTAPPRFSQLLRSRIKGGSIVNVDHRGNERLVCLFIRSQSIVYHLWLRLWSGNPNIILTDENHIIIDVLFRKSKYGEFSGEYFNPDFSHLMQKKTRETEVRSYKGYELFNDFIEHYYSRKTDENDFFRKKNIECKRIINRISKTKSHLEKLEKRKSRYLESETLKERAELILANLHGLKKGVTHFEVEDYNHNNEAIVISLKPELSPLENSEDYFKKYKKYNNGLKLVDEEINQQEIRLLDLQILLKNLDQSESLEQLIPLIGTVKEESSRRNKKTIGLLFHSYGYEIYVGRNSKENDFILRNKSRGNDIWLHVRDYPGGYVVIKSTKGKSIPLDTLIDGANLALLYSSKKNKDIADIHYTEVKNIRRVKGGKEGAVLVEKDKNLFITYDEQRIKKLQQKIPLLETNHLKTDN